MTTLYTNGCSFTYGAELDNRELRYGHLLANKLGCEYYVDDSLNGSGNDRILRTTLDYLQDPNINLEDLCVVIGWSGISRKEFFVNDIGWHTITPTGIGSNELINTYYTYLQSVQQDNLNFYYQTLLLQMWLEKKNVKYFMFRIDDGQTKQMIKDGSKKEVTDGYDTSYLTKEQAKDINIKTFPSYLSNGMTFREYALRNGGGLKPQRHPDEKSHGLFAEYLYQNLKGK